jgi:hypothetical protein
MTRQRVTTLAIVAAGVTLATAGVWYKWSSDNQFFRPSRLLSRFPAEEAAVFSIDFAALRSAGLLTASKAPLEPDYQAFLTASGFDYRRDLDFAVASISKSGNFIIARGRFDWGKLGTYAGAHGGSCYQDLCRMPGSTPDRRISFLPLRRDTIALAVSSDDLGALRLTKTGDPVNTPLPDAPAWVSVPGGILRQQSVVPSGLRLLLSALTTADRIVFTFGPTLEAHLEAQCHSKDDARVLASQLRTATALVKEGIQQKKLPSGDALAQFLSSGTFEDSGQRVAGRWPISRDLVQNLTEGI